jgi:hypothetical protein
VNAISPGTIRSATLEARFREVAHAKGLAAIDAPWEEIEKVILPLFAQVPVDRVGTLDEIAHAITFLASPTASYIAGVNLRVDGGLSPGNPDSLWSSVSSQAMLLPLDRFDVDPHHSGRAKIVLGILESIACEKTDDPVQNLNLLGFLFDEICSSNANDSAVFRFEVARLVTFDYALIDRDDKTDLRISFEDLDLASSAS